MSLKILVISDIHLGSLDSEKDQLIQFLRNIINGGFGKDLKVLLILGDFIDLCTDLPKTILQRKKIQEIVFVL